MTAHPVQRGLANLIPYRPDGRQSRSRTCRNTSSTPSANRDLIDGMSGAEMMQRRDDFLLPVGRGTGTHAAMC